MGRLAYKSVREARMVGLGGGVETCVGGKRVTKDRTCDSERSRSLRLNEEW